MKVHSSRIKNWIPGVSQISRKLTWDKGLQGISDRLIRRVLIRIGVLVMALAGIAAGSAAHAEGIIQKGPQVTVLDSVISATQYDQMVRHNIRFNGNIVYGEWVTTPPADWNGGGTIPAKVEAVVGSSTKPGVATHVKKWVPLEITGANLAKLTRIASAAGALLTAIEIAEWVAARGWERDENGQIVKNEERPLWYQSTRAPDAPPYAECANVTEWVGAYPNYDAAQAACTAHNNGVTCGAGGGPVSCGQSSSPWMVRYHEDTSQSCPQHGGCRYYFAFNNVYPQWATSVPGSSSGPVSHDELENAIKEGLRNNDALTRRVVDEAVGRIKSPIGNANQGWPNQPTKPYQPPALTPQQGQELQTIVNNSVTNTTINNIKNEGDTYINNETVPPDPGDPAAPLGPEDDPEVPEEQPIPEKLDTFWSSIENLPVLSLLKDIEIQAGGSPIVHITIPRCFVSGGQTLIMDFSNDSLLGVNYAYFFGLVGNVLLAFCGIRWTMYLFKSGE